MATDVQSSLQRLAGKCNFLVDRYKVVDAERRQALERVAQLEAELDRQRLAVERLQTEVQYLRISSALTPGAADVDSTRAMISQMVNDIDRCIAELKE